MNPNAFSLPSRLVGTCFVLAFVALFAAIPAQADSPVYIPVALAPVQRDTPVELVALTLDAEISENNGRTVVSGNSTFKVHNTDRLNDLQAPVGFPAWAGDPYAFDPARLDAFSVSVDGKKVTLNASRADLKVGSVIRAVDWYTFTLTIGGDEKKTVRFDFQQDLGETGLPRFVYGMATAAGWKGSVGSTRLSLRFPENTSPDQIAAVDPTNTSFDGANLAWSFLTHEPTVNPALTFLRPSLWNELVNRRRGVLQNPNDATARAALGSLLRQLTLLDSPRRDNYAAQAIAELEFATRLDPAQRAARQSLASLYESRAGPATGPRQAAYVQLAIAQWETLASTDAAARKQLAEDYFYLGLDAQTRNAYADAAKYFDQAVSSMPNGSGPLYTPERLAAQRRALYLAWARDLIARDDYASAASQAQLALGEAFMASLKAPPFFVTRTDVTMAASARSIVLRLVPFAIAENELKESLEELAESLRRVGAEASVGAENGDLTLTIDIPFKSQAELSVSLLRLGETIPDRSEWALVHALMSPVDLTWSASTEWWNNSMQYEEEFDLSPACATFEAELQAIRQAAKPLESASVDDVEAQLKRELYLYAQSGWQRALAQGRVTARAGAHTATVPACSTQVVAFSTLPIRVELIAVCAAGFWILGMLVLFAWWRMRTAKRRQDRSGLSS